MNFGVKDGELEIQYGSRHALEKEKNNRGQHNWYRRV